jgi:hypothetical protein
VKELKESLHHVEKITFFSAAPTPKMGVMNRVLVNVSKDDWATHFIGPDGKTRVGPWLLHDTHEEVLKILRWGDVTPEELAEHESSLRKWGCSSIVLMLTDAKLKALIERGRGRPWNGYKLRLMKKAGKYPPQRISLGDSQVRR